MVHCDRRHSSSILSHLNRERERERPEINMTVTECALIDFLLTSTVATWHVSCIHPF